MFSDSDFETVTVTRPRRTSEPAACLFENSRFVDFEKFEAEFKGPEFENVDIVYYYHAVADWSAQKGKKMMLLKHTAIFLWFLDSFLPVDF